MQDLLESHITGLFKTEDKREVFLDLQEICV